MDLLENRTKYVALFPSHEVYKRMVDRIRYLIMSKSNISDVYSHKYMNIKIKIDDLPLEKTLNVHHVVIFKSFLKKYNHFYNEKL